MIQLLAVLNCFMNFTVQIHLVSIHPECGQDVALLQVSVFCYALWCFIPDSLTWRNFLYFLFSFFQLPLPKPY